MTELDCLHDVIFDSTGKSLDAKALAVELDNLPESVKNDISTWTIYDTVVRELIWDYYRKEWERHINKDNYEM